MKINVDCSDTNAGIDNAAFEFTEDKFEYQASSPDEKALAEACQRFLLIQSFTFVNI